MRGYIKRRILANSYCPVTPNELAAIKKLVLVFGIMSIATGIILSSAAASLITSDKPAAAARKDKRINESTVANQATKEHTSEAAETLGAGDNSNTAESQPEPQQPSHCEITPFAMPQAPDPAGQPVGVTKIIDNPAYYHVKLGTNSNKIQQVTACARQQPALAPYHAVTTYNINWSFNAEPTLGQLCRVSSPKVVVRIKQFLPSVSGATDSYINSRVAQLVAHEDEHTAIDINHAQKLYQALSTTTGNCSTIIADANNKANAIISDLEHANDHLDAVTNHGTN